MLTHQSRVASTQAFSVSAHARSHCNCAWVEKRREKAWTISSHDACRDCHSASESDFRKDSDVTALELNVS